MTVSRPTLELGPCPVQIAASASAFPPDVEDTATLLARIAPEVPEARRLALVQHFDAQIGVQTRAHLREGHALDLAVRAARQALDQSSAGPPCAVVVATSTPSRWTAAESALVARALDLSCAFLDVRSGCTGGLHAIVTAARLVRDAGRPVLVVGADAFSLTFGSDRVLPVSMGDGAGALVLAPCEDGSVGIVRALFGGAPDLVDLATVPATLPLAALAPDTFQLRGDPETFSAAAEDALGLALDALAPPADAWVVVHTGRAATARRVASRVGREPFLDVLTKRGNVGAATLFVALDLLRADASCSQVALVSAGGGLSFGAALLRMRP